MYRWLSDMEIIKSTGIIGQERLSINLINQITDFASPSANGTPP